MSTLRNINLLKSAKSTEEEDELMTSTFGARRKAIVDDGATTDELKADYPALFKSDQVIMMI